MDKLKVENIHLHYGTNPILRGVSIGVGQGEVVVLLGPSGSGKTSLLRSIAGLEVPQQGSISIDGKVLFDAAAKIDVPIEKRNLGLVFQSYALWPHRTVRDNVGYGLKLRSMTAQEVEARTQAALEQLGLGALGDRFPHQLSGGQQQRVAIARALVYSPPVILMDEPLSNLDAKLREEAKAWLRSLILDLKLSAVVVTHDQSEAMAMADRIVLLSDGTIEQEGPPQEIYYQPDTLFAAEFFGSNNRLEGTASDVSKGSAVIGGDGWRARGTVRGGDLAAGEPCVGVARVERLRIVGSGGDNRFEVRLVTSMFGGDRFVHLVRLGEMQLRIASPGPLTGEKHWLEIPASDLWIFKRRASTAA